VSFCETDFVRPVKYPLGVVMTDFPYQLREIRHHEGVSLLEGGLFAFMNVVEAPPAEVENPAGCDDGVSGGEVTSQSTESVEPKLECGG